MKRIICLALILTCLGASSLALAGTFKIKDGSTIDGQLVERNIKVKTAYGEATFKAQDIVSYHDGVLKLRDGNSIKGTILNRSLKVKTATGTFTIEPTKLLSFEQ